MSNFLVTGGMGFIGSHLVEQLVNEGHTVSVIDNMSNGTLKNIASVERKIKYNVMNVEWKNKLEYGEKYDGIFHLATAPRSSSMIDPMKDIETNCKGMIAMLELAKKSGAKVVFTSNSGIYGSMINEGSIDEHSINNPTTPYDANKLVSEYYAKIYHTLHGVKSAIIRFATVYGERQRVNEELNWKPLVATFVKNMVNNEVVIINGDGKQTRDLIYVKDAVQGVIKAMYSKVENADICLISSNTEVSVNEVLKIIEDLMHRKAIVRHTEALKGDIRRMRYSYDKAKKMIGYKPRYSALQGIKNMINFTIQENQKQGKPSVTDAIM